MKNQIRNEKLESIFSILKMCGGFFLKFSNTEVNSEDRTTLTHNGWVYM